MRKTLIAVALVATCSGVSLPSYGADLIQYYRDAALNDAAFAGARDALLAGEEKIPQGRAGLLPQVSMTASVLRNRIDIVEPPYPSYTQPYTARAFNLTLTQPLFRVANFEQYQQSKLSEEVAKAQFAQAQQDLILRVAQAYFDILNAQDSIHFLAAQKVAITEQLASAKRTFEVGTATITDTNEATARYDLAEAQEIAARSDLEIKLGAFAQIIGHEASDLAPLRTGVKLSPPEPRQLAPWLASAETENSAVVQAEANAQIAKRQIRVERAGHYPSLDLVAGRQFNSQPTGIIPPEIGSTADNSVGIQLTIPIFSGGMTSSKVREAIALEDKAGHDLQAARRAAAQSARSAFVGVTSGLAQVNALEAAQVSSQSSLDSNKLGYQVGVRINIDVLNAQQQLYSTDRDLAKARYDTLMSSLRLKSSSGALTEDDLVAINMLLLH